MLHIIARFIFYVFFKTFFRLKIFGKENFPKDSAVIVASNHRSFFDPVIVGISTPRRLDFIARDSLFRFKPFGRILSSVNAIPMKRNDSDIKAFRQILERLRRHRAVLIFPEGTRSKDGNLQDPRYGIGMLEVKSGSMILPCYVKGSGDVLPPGAIFPRFRPISVYFGKPLKFSSMPIPDRKKQYIAIAREVMSAIAKLKEKAEGGAVRYTLHDRR